MANNEKKVMRLYCFIRKYQIESKKKGFDLFKFCQQWINKK